VYAVRFVYMYRCEQSGWQESVFEGSRAHSEASQTHSEASQTHSEASQTHAGGS
jgi:hypothetical protein